MLGTSLSIQIPSRALLFGSEKRRHKTDALKSQKRLDRKAEEVFCTTHSQHVYVHCESTCMLHVRILVCCTSCIKVRKLRTNGCMYTTRICVIYAHRVCPRDCSLTCAPHDYTHCTNTLDLRAKKYPYTHDGTLGHTYYTNGAYCLYTLCAQRRHSCTCATREFTPQDAQA